MSAIYNLAPLHHKGTTIKGVHDDVPALEEGIVSPSTQPGVVREFDLRVVLREDVEESHLLDSCTGGVGTNRRDVEDADPSGVMRLVREHILDILIVIDRNR